MYEISLFRDELCETVDVTWSFLFRERVLKPRSITREIKIGDRINVGAEKDFENELTDILVSILIHTEAVHVKNFYRRIVLYDLS